MSERGKAALTALLASINTAVLLWALYSEIVNAIYVAFGYIAIMVLIERIIESEGKDEMKNEELRYKGYEAAKSDDTAAKHGAVDKLTDGAQTTARECHNAAKAIREFTKLLRNNCTIRHRDGQLEAVIGYANIDELAEKFLKEGVNDTRRGI